MMNQFTVINGYLCVMDMSRYDAFYGFNRAIRKLYQTKYN